MTQTAQQSRSSGSRRKRNLPIIFVVATALVAAVCLAVFVWPTRYRYDSFAQDGVTILLRTDRFSGEAEMVYPIRKPVESFEKPPAVKPEENLPPDQVLRLQGSASMPWAGWLNCQIYNGSDWEVREIAVLVNVVNADGTLALSRSYRQANWVNPMAANDSGCALGFNLLPGQKWNWSILGARGVPSDLPKIGDAFDTTPPPPPGFVPVGVTR